MCSTASVQVNVEAGVWPTPTDGASTPGHRRRSPAGPLGTSSAAGHPAALGPAARHRTGLGGGVRQLTAPRRQTDGLEEHQAGRLDAAGSRPHRCPADPPWRGSGVGVHPVGAGRSVAAGAPRSRALDRPRRGELSAMAAAGSQRRSGSAPANDRRPGLPPDHPVSAGQAARASRGPVHRRAARRVVDRAAGRHRGAARRRDGGRPGQGMPAHRPKVGGGTRPGSAWTMPNWPGRPPGCWRSPRRRSATAPDHTWLAGQVEGYLERWTARGRCPADDPLAGFDRPVKRAQQRKSGG